MRKIYITVALLGMFACLPFTPQGYAQVEGLAMQIKALKSMMESYADSVNGSIAALGGRIDGVEGRLDGVEGRVDDLEDLETSMNRCFNKTNNDNEAFIYWPTHAEADGQGCVVESDISYTADPSVLCDPRRPVALLGGDVECTKCLDDGGALHDYRTAAEKQTGAPAELTCRFSGRTTCPATYVQHNGIFGWTPNRCTGRCTTCTSAGGWRAYQPTCRYEQGSDCGQYGTCRSSRTGIECK